MSKEHPLRFGFLIHDVSRLRRTVADKALGPLGITRSQSWVLAYLHRHSGSGVTQSQLAEEMNVGKVTLGGLIARLEESGCVERRRDVNDRRAWRIHMTRKGVRLVTRMQKVSESLNNEILADISEQDVRRLERVLSTVKSKLLSMTDASHPSGKIAGD